MEHEKTIIEKLTDAVKGAANSIVDAASNAAETGIKSNAARMFARGGQVAGTGNEQIFIPEATDAAAMPVPFTVARAARKKRKPRARPAPAKIPRKKAAASKTARKARKSASKKAKSATGRKAVTKKKSAAKKKRAKKARR